MNTPHATRLYTATATLAIAAAVFAAPVYAQDDHGRAAHMAGQWMPAGEAAMSDYPSTAPSVKTRAERKAETMQARRNGEFQPGGMGLYKSNMSQQQAKSFKTRAERKAETLQAAREHKLMRAGEAG